MHDLRAAHSALVRHDWPTAWRIGNAALNDQPDSPEALFIVGSVLRAQGNEAAAIALLSKALARERKQPNLWMVYAACLHDLNQWADAEEAFTVVHKMIPRDPMPIANIAATYVQRGRWHDAINWADRALTIDPTNHIARITKGFGCLSLGRWRDAWQYHEALYGNHLIVRVYNDRENEEPEWDGSPGKTVVVQCDQGLGDQIMFAQCLPQMIADCKLVIIDCSERMEGFFKHNFPEAHVYGTLKQARLEWPQLYKIDARIHISALGRFYRHTDADFPRRPYIEADPARLAKWRDWLAQFPGPHIGIAWQGGVQGTQTHLRSMQLADFAPILERPGTFIDLSYKDSALEVARWNIDHKVQVIRPPIDVRDYEDTIALVAALDKVISVTTSVVHVCGALGKEAHVLVPEVAQWRYAYRYGDGTRMIWYSDSVRMYRRIKGEADWKPTISRLCNALEAA